MQRRTGDSSLSLPLGDEIQETITNDKEDRKRIFLPTERRNLLIPQYWRVHMEILSLLEPNMFRIIKSKQQEGLGGGILTVL